MGGYSVYRTMKSWWLSKVRREAKASGIPKKQRSDKRLFQILVERTAVSAEGKTSDGRVSMVDEYHWERNGSRVFFPESAELLNMLWRAKMDVLPDDLEFPSVFSLAWPSGFSINGVEVPPCIVYWESPRRYTSIASAFSREHGEDDSVCMWSDSETLKAHADESMFHIFLWRNEDGGPTSGRVTLSKDGLREYLRTEGGSVGFDSQCDVYIASRLAVALIVYLNAEKSALVPGWPSDVSRRKLKHEGIKCGEGSIIAAPKCPNGEHGSPCAHYRRWHFRRYPLKSDGTRTAGVVFVRDTMVNAEIDPSTVLENVS